MNYTQHPLSAAYPSMTDDEFQALKDSISEIGVQSPIVIFENQVIDGWNRYKASGELAMPCPAVAFDTAVNPVDFVKAMNDARRHLTASQRAIAAVSIYQWRPSAGRPVNSVPGTELLKTTKEIAKESGVSVTMIEKAKAAHKAGFADAVKDGALTVKEAASIASGKPAKPVTKPAPVAQEEEGAPDQAEFDSVAAAQKAEEMAMRLLLASDEPLADVTANYKQALLQIERLNARIVGLQNQSLHQIKTIKGLQAKLKKMEAA